MAREYKSRATDTYPDLLSVAICAVLVLSCAWRVGVTESSKGLVFYLKHPTVCLGSASLAAGVLMSIVTVV